MLLLGLTDNIRGPVFPQVLQYFSVSDTVGALSFAVASTFAFLSGLSCDFWIHRWGSVRTLRVAMGIMGLSQLVMGLAESYLIFLFGAVLLGCSFGLMGVIQNSLVVTESPAHLRNRLLSVLHSMYAGASLLAPLLVNAVISINGAKSAWRWSFLVVAAFSFLLVILSFLEKRKSHDAQVHVAPQDVLQAPDFARRLYVAVMLSCYVGAEILVSSRMTLFMTREYSMTVSEGNQLTAFFFLGLLLGRVAFSFWIPSWKLKNLLLSILSLSLASLMFGLYVHPYGLALTGLMMSPFYPLMMSFIGSEFPRTLNKALALAVAFSSLFVVIMHTSVGWLTEQYGIRHALLAGPAFCLLPWGMLILYEKIFRRVPAPV